MQAYNTDEFKLLRETRKNMIQRCGDNAPWSQGLEFGKTDFFLAVVISYCERLSSINLDFHYGASKSMVELVLRCERLSEDSEDDPDVPPLFYFQKLKSVEFTGQNVAPEEMERNHEATMDINHLLPALFLSSVESIKASCISRTALMEPVDPVMQYSALFSLVIEKARCNEWDLERLLSMCSSLRELVWDRMCDRHYAEGCQLDCSALYEGLLHVKQTIEVLRISVEFYATIDLHISKRQIRGSIGSLQDFPKLTHLHAPFAVLLGWSRAQAPVTLQEILPPNLISFTLTDQTYRMAENQLDFRYHLKRLCKYLVETRTGRGASVTTAGTGFDQPVNLGLELDPKCGVTRLACGMTAQPARSMNSTETATSYPGKSQERLGLTTLANTDGPQELHLHVCHHEWVEFAEYLDVEQICNSTGVRFNLVQPES